MNADQLAAKLRDSDLDDYQKGFCAAKSRAVRLLAPAGSGKTYSLLWRCFNHFDLAGDEKPRFLIFTFARATREELRDRLKSEAMFQPMCPYVEITTLNAWGYRRLRARMHGLQLLTSGRDFYRCVNNTLQPVWQNHERMQAVVTTTRAKNRTAKAIIDLIDYFKALGFRHDVHHDPDAFAKHLRWLRESGLMAHIQAVVKMLSDIGILTPNEHKPLEAVHRHFIRFWAAACVHMRNTSVITLEDQKYWAYVELDEARRNGQYTTGMHRFDHVLVDEFQDINMLDLNLLRTIAAVNKSELTIVGDDDQAIYEWRGAIPEFIISPDKHIGPGYTTCILEKNYRSPRNIVELSQRLIRFNTRRVDKNVRAASDQTAEIRVLRMQSLADSVEYVLREARSMLGDPAVKKVAIIGRKRSQIIPYQITFAREGIPFYAAEDLHVLLGDAFNDLKEMLAIKARAGHEPIPGLDPVTDLLKVCDKVRRYPLSRDDRDHLRTYLLLERPRSLTAALDSLRRYRGPLGGRTPESFFQAIQALLRADTVSDTIDSVSENFEGLQRNYGRALEDIFYLDPPFLYLSDYARRYGRDYSAFYDDVEKAVATLARIPTDDDEPEAGQNRELRLHLMTALRAKGKEFDVVIILDANLDIWPSKLATSEEQLEQERRLFYVAFTRARKRLVLLVNEAILGNAATPSPYLFEMGLRPNR